MSGTKALLFTAVSSSLYFVNIRGQHHTVAKYRNMVYLVILNLVLFLQSFALSEYIKLTIDEPIDLTWAVDVNSTAWINTKKFTYTKNLEGLAEDGSWYASNEFCTGEHAGTHLDAPYHFNQKGWKVAEIPLNRLFVKGVVIDVTEDVKRFGREAELTVEHLTKWQETHGVLPENCVVLIRFGWSQFYGDHDKYMGEGVSPTFPGISRAAADWLANSGKVVGVGLDTPSVDRGNSTTFDTHKIFSAKQIYGLENVHIVQHLPATGFNLVVMPIKLQFGTGGPVRIIAIPEKHMAAGL